MLNIKPRKIDWKDEDEFVRNIFSSSWETKEEAISLAKNEHYACPPLIETYGQSILDAIDEHFEER